MSYTPKQARILSNITVRNMADYLNIAQSTYCNKEAGKSDFTVPEAVKFCTATRLQFSDVNFLWAKCSTKAGHADMKKERR